MNGMPVHSWPHLSAVANWLATYWIHSSLVLGAAWLLDRSVLRRPRLVEAVWKFALVAGLITATLQSALGIRPLGGQRPLPWIAPATAAVARPELAPAQPELAPAPPVRVSAAPRPRRPAAVLPLAVRTDRHPSEVAPALAPAAAPARAAKPASAVAVVSARPEVPLALVLFIGAWGLGGAIALAGLARSWHRFRRRLSGRAEVADGGTRATLRALCRVAGRRRAVRLTRCSSVDVPLAMGVHRHEICVPERALAELDGERIEALLAHELAHVTRRDPAWVLLLNVIGRAFFLQPLHWLAARRLAACSELACDDLAAQWTQRPLALARCLADVAGWLIESRARLPATAPAMAGTPSLLRRRVERLLAAPRALPERLPLWFPPVAALAVAAALLLAPSCASWDEGAPPPPQGAVIVAPLPPPGPGQAPELLVITPQPLVQVAPVPAPAPAPAPQPHARRGHVMEVQPDDCHEGHHSGCHACVFDDDDDDPADADDDDDDDDMPEALEDLPDHIQEALEAVEEARTALSAQTRAALEKEVGRALEEARRSRPSRAELAEVQEQVRRAMEQVNRAMEQAVRNLPPREELERVHDQIRRAMEEVRRSLKQGDQRSERERARQQARQLAEQARERAREQARQLAERAREHAQQQLERAQQERERAREERERGRAERERALEESRRIAEAQREQMQEQRERMKEERERMKEDQRRAAESKRDQERLREERKRERESSDPKWFR